MIPITATEMTSATMRSTPAFPEPLLALIGVCVELVFVLVMSATLVAVGFDFVVDVLVAMLLLVVVAVAEAEPVMVGVLADVISEVLVDFEATVVV